MLLLKSSLLVGLLAVILQPSGASPIDELIKKINEGRAEHAKTMNIANMHKIQWDEGMVHKASTWTTRQCKDFRSGSDYRFLFLGSGASYDKYEKAVFNYYQQMLLTLRADDVKKRVQELGGQRLELIQPLQTKIGCVAYKCAYRYEINDAVYEGIHETLCLLGPHGDFWNHGAKIGTPGTQCGGKRVENGLCVSPSSRRFISQNLSQKVAQENLNLELNF